MSGSDSILVMAIIAMGLALGLTPFAISIRYKPLRWGALGFLAIIAAIGLASIALSGIIHFPRDGHL